MKGWWLRDRERERVAKESKCDQGDIDEGGAKKCD